MAQETRLHALELNMNQKFRSLASQIETLSSHRHREEHSSLDKTVLQQELRSAGSEICKSVDNLFAARCAEFETQLNLMLAMQTELRTIAQSVPLSSLQQAIPFTPTESTKHGLELQDVKETQWRPLVDFINNPPQPTPKATESAVSLQAELTGWAVAGASIDAARRMTQDRIQEGSEAARLIDDPGMVFAIVLYTFDVNLVALGHPKAANFYFQLNAKLRLREGHFLKAAHSYLYYLMTGLSRLPCHSGSVFRGIDAEKADSARNKFKQGSKHHWSAFSSSTLNIALAEDFSKYGGIILKINLLSSNSRSKNISILSAIPSEEEVLLLPNLPLLVIGCSTTSLGTEMIELCEVEDAPVVIDF